jgi:hypothetical protein
MKILLLLASLYIAQTTTGHVVSGRVTMDDGSALPVAAGFQGPYVLFRLSASPPGFASPIATSDTRPDGSFELSLSMAGSVGQFAITPTMIPYGYYVKSINYGTVDLLRSPVAITAHDTTQLQVVLTKTPPVGRSGFKVSGRVTQLQNFASGASVSISVQYSVTSPNTLPFVHIGDEEIKDDGSFEISAIPAGRYSIQTTPARGPMEFEVVDREVSGLEIALTTAGTRGIRIMSVPFGPYNQSVRGSPVLVAGPSAPLIAPTGAAMVSVSQSGGNALAWREGALHFFRIERSGALVEEKKLESGPLTFTLSPGSYELRGYSRGCSANCGVRIGAPEAQCIVPFAVTAGQVLYAERVIQSTLCTIRLNAPPQ